MCKKLITDSVMEAYISSALRTQRRKLCSVGGMRDCNNAVEKEMNREMYCGLMNGGWGRRIF